jgi:hypothetical protein
MSGGVIVINGDIETNCSLDALIGQHRSALSVRSHRCCSAKLFITKSQDMLGGGRLSKTKLRDTGFPISDLHAPGTGG